MAFTSLSTNRMQSIIDGKLDKIIAAVCKITDYKKMFLLHPVIATDAEIERETGLKRAEIARISREREQVGQLYYGRTINGNYCRLTQKTKSQELVMKQFIEEVKAHLEKVAQKDEAFAAKFNAKCEEEQGSIEKCCGYIVSEVQRKYKTGNSAVLTKDEVFGMAMHYYDENLQNVPTASCRVVVAKEELTEADKERLRKEAREEAERAVKAEEYARIAREKALAEEKARKAEEAKAKKAAEAERKRQEELERKRKEWETADCLFNFDEE